MFNDNVKIALKNCSSGYQNKGRKIELLKNINLNLKKGELVALIGKNGSGKTTLLKTIVGLLPILDGGIFFDGINLEELSPNDLAKKTGFHSALIPENQEMIVEDLVRLGRYPYTNLFGMLNIDDYQMIEIAMKECGILHLRKKNLQQLSDGERQRAMLARVFAQDTDVILLDEPTSHLDIPNKFEILHLLQSLAHKGKTILFTTHDLNLASSYADKLWLIHRHAIVEGAPEDLILGAELKEQFETEKLKFDRDSGEFLPNRFTPFKVYLEANKQHKTAVKWTKKALKRKGIGVSLSQKETNSNHVFISISKEKDTFAWNLEYHDDNIRFLSIYQLIAKLEKILKNDLD